MSFIVIFLAIEAMVGERHPDGSLKTPEASYGAKKQKTKLGIENFGIEPNMMVQIQGNRTLSI